MQSALTSMYKCVDELEALEALYDQMDQMEQMSQEPGFSPEPRALTQTTTPLLCSNPQYVPLLSDSQSGLSTTTTAPGEGPPGVQQAHAEAAPRGPALGGDSGRIGVQIGGSGSEPAESAVGGSSPGPTLVVRRGSVGSKSASLIQPLVATEAGGAAMEGGTDGQKLVLDVDRVGHASVGTADEGSDEGALPGTAVAVVVGGGGVGSGAAMTATANDGMAVPAAGSTPGVAGAAGEGSAPVVPLSDAAVVAGRLEIVSAGGPSALEREGKAGPASALARENTVELEAILLEERRQQEMLKQELRQAKAAAEAHAKEKRIAQSQLRELVSELRIFEDAELPPGEGEPQLAQAVPSFVPELQRKSSPERPRPEPNELASSAVQSPLLTPRQLGTGEYAWPSQTPTEMYATERRANAELFTAERATGGGKSNPLMAPSGKEISNSRAAVYLKGNRSRRLSGQTDISSDELSDAEDMEPASHEHTVSSKQASSDPDSEDQQVPVFSSREGIKGSGCCSRGGSNCDASWWKTFQLGGLFDWD